METPEEIVTKRSKLFRGYQTRDLQKQFSREQLSVNLAMSFVAVVGSHQMMFFLFLATLLLSQSSAHEYEESISEMLIQCNSFQDQTMLKNRTVHHCEKQDPDGDFSYYITPMLTRYSEREFLCVLFFKDEFARLDFKILFTHGKYKIDAVS